MAMPHRNPWKRRTDRWEFGGTSSTEDLAAQRRSRPRRLVLSIGLTALFFTGAAFTAVAGDGVSRFMEKDSAGGPPAPSAGAAPGPPPPPPPQPAPPADPAPAAHSAGIRGLEGRSHDLPDLPPSRSDAARRTPLAEVCDAAPGDGEAERSRLGAAARHRPRRRRDGREARDTEGARRPVPAARVA